MTGLYDLPNARARDLRAQATDWSSVLAMACLASTLAGSATGVAFAAGLSAFGPPATCVVPWPGGARNEVPEDHPAHGYVFGA